MLRLFRRFENTHAFEFPLLLRDFFTTTIIHIHIHTSGRAYRIRFRRTGIAACCGYFRHRRNSWCVATSPGRLSHALSRARPLSLTPSLSLSHALLRAHVLRFVLRWPGWDAEASAAGRPGGHRRVDRQRRARDPHCCNPHLARDENTLHPRGRARRADGQTRPISCVQDRRHPRRPRPPHCHLGSRPRHPIRDHLSGFQGSDVRVVQSPRGVPSSTNNMMM